RAEEKSTGPLVEFRARPLSGFERGGMSHLSSPPPSPRTALADDARVLVVIHLPLVAQVARTIAKHARQVLREELEAVGALGLVEAALRFGDRPRASFGAFAHVRIRGAMLDVLRQEKKRTTREREADVETFAGDSPERLVDFERAASVLRAAAKKLDA